jgi:hypothetical protein
MTIAETPGYYWDWWETKAVATGVPVHLPRLGRELMRDMAQHTAGEVRGLGHVGDGHKMIAMALAAPTTTELRFASDLRTPVGVSGRIDEEAFKVLAARFGGGAALGAVLNREKDAFDAAVRSVRTHSFFQDAFGRMTIQRLRNEAPKPTS